MKIPAAIAKPCTAALNWMQGKREPTRLERLQMAVTTVAKVILSGLIISGITYGMGSAMIYAGTTLAGASTLTTLPAYVALPIEYCGAGLLHSGTAIAAFGRGVFLAITVPLYAVCYEAPQVIYAHALPYLNASMTCISTVAAQALQLLNQALATIAEGACSISNSVYTTLQPYLQSIASTITGIANSIWSSLHPIMSQITTALSHTIQQIWAHVYAIGQQIATAVGPLLSQVTTGLSYALEALGDVVSSIWANMYGLGQQIATWMGHAVTQLGAALAPVLESITSVASAAWANIAAMAHQVATHLGNVMSSIGGAVYAIGQQISTALSPYVAGVANTVSLVWAYVYEAAATAAHAINNHVSEGCSALQTAIVTAMHSVSATYTQTFG